MKLQRIDNSGEDTLGYAAEPEIRTLPSGIVVEEMPDFSQRVKVPDSLIRGGLTIVFRDPSQEDLEFLEVQLKKAESQQEAMRRFGCRICTQWGDRPGITMPEWAQLRGKASLAILQVLNDFFPDLA